MSTALILFLAALLPMLAAVIAKAGGKSFSNRNPREWLEAQAGWRGRANAAQKNTFEALPLFYAAVIYAHFSHADVELLQAYALAWLLLRLLYIFAYLKDWASLRSIVWGLALVINALLLFTAPLA